MSNNTTNSDTILAFTEWLDEKGYSYLMFLAKDGGGGVVSNGDSEEIAKSIVCTLLEHPPLMDIIVDAMNIVLGNDEDDEEDED
jgi:hypothetical protein